MPFTRDEFLNVFVQYNESIFPLQFLFFVFALLVLFVIIKKSKQTGVITSLILGVFWLWIGIYYHLILFAVINPAAYAFGAVFVLQGFFFIYEGVVRKNLAFKIDKSIYSYVGLLFILYALIIYPVLGSFFGHEYPANPTFGLPCPTTIFTFGILMFLSKKFPYYIISIPMIWALVGSTAAFRLSIYEDIGLLIAGVVGFTLLIFKNKKMAD